MSSISKDSKGEPMRKAKDLGCQSEKRFKFIEMLSNEPANGDMSGQEPNVSVIPSGETARAAYGYRYGAELLKFNISHLDALLNGHQLAVEISQGEYVLFIETDRDMQDKPLWTEVKYWEGRIPPPEYFAALPVDSSPSVPALKIKDYARQTGRDPTELSREEINQLIVERKHDERSQKNV